MNTCKECGQQMMTEREKLVHAIHAAYFEALDEIPQPWAELSTPNRKALLGGADAALAFNAEKVAQLDRDLKAAQDANKLNAVERDGFQEAAYGLRIRARAAEDALVEVTALLKVRMGEIDDMRARIREAVDPPSGTRILSKGDRFVEQMKDTNGRAALFEFEYQGNGIAFVLPNPPGCNNPQPHAEPRKP
jgi:hypothetical protein